MKCLSWWVALACLAWGCAVARGQAVSTSVSMNISGHIANEGLLFGSSVPFEIVAAPAYIYSITGNVHGEGPLFSTLVPTSEPLGTALDAISPGLSSALNGAVSNPGAQLPSSTPTVEISSGANGIFNATFSLSMNASGEASFSMANMALVINGQPDSTDELVFDSGSVELTALFQDVNVATSLATNITTSGATLNALVSCPNSFQTYFIYSVTPLFSGTNPALNGTSAFVSLAASGTSQAVAIPVTGLEPHRVYYYRGVGTDVTGPTYGNLGSFETLDVPPVAGSVTAFAGLAPISIPVLSSVTESEGAVLKVTAVSQSIAGVASISSGRTAVTYQFTSNTEPVGHFTYTVADGFGGSSTGSVMVVNYATLAATYYAVLFDPLSQTTADGFLRVTLGSSGQFTGLLNFNGVNYPFTGALNSSGSSLTRIKSSSLGNINVSLNMVQTGNGYVLSAGVEGGVVGLLAALPPAAAGLGGTYTLVMPPPPGASYQGSGYATIQVAASGQAVIAGQMPDGAAFSCPSVVASTGETDVYAPLYAPANRGALVGTLAISSPGTASLSGTLVWTKPAGSNAIVNQGPFAISLTGSGGQYTAPVGVPALQFNTIANIGQVMISGGPLLSPIQHGVAIAVNNQVTILGPGYQALALRIQPATGLFAGQFLSPTTGVRQSIHGALLQGSQSAGGFFMGISAGGAVNMTP
jgi:hypothetical protein